MKYMRRKKLNITYTYNVLSTKGENEFRSKSKYNVGTKPPQSKYKVIFQVTYIRFPIYINWSTHWKGNYTSQLFKERPNFIDKGMKILIIMHAVVDIFLISIYLFFLQYEYMYILANDLMLYYKWDTAKDIRQTRIVFSLLLFFFWQLRKVRKKVLNPK